MDKNGLIGLLMISAIIIGWQVWTSPSAAEVEAQKRAQDSIAQVEAAMARAEAQVATAGNQEELVNPAGDSIQNVLDSLEAMKRQAEFGSFHSAMKGEEETFRVQTDKLELWFTNKGAKLMSARLLDYNTYYDKPLYLFTADSSNQNLSFSYKGKSISLNDLYFDASFTELMATGDGTVNLQFVAKTADGGSINVDYNIPGDDYLIDYNLAFTNLGEVMAENRNQVQLDWSMSVPSKEKGRKFERNNTTFFYKPVDDKVDYVSEMSDVDEVIEESVRWISFKQQFFSMILKSENAFDANQMHVVVKSLEPDTSASKYMALSAPLNLNNGVADMQLYLGPNKYSGLKEYNQDFEDQINLGWAIFGWVNRFMVIPVFDFFEGFNLNYGVIIIILTLLFKLVLSPVTYKTYLSSAKMKALKPEIEELNKKFKKGEEMQKQQAMMSLYRETGVNPLAGCIPALVQMPILYALFRFFPSSIELRGKSFLWAEDLSTYDSVLDLGFSIPFYGDHISAFTLLMSVSLFLYSKNNMEMSSMGGGAQASQMKIMTYMMPVMFLFFFNEYAAGLSLYYLTSNIVTMGQQFVIRNYVIDEEKLRAKLQENKAKPKKKSKWAQRMEKIQEQQEQQQNRRSRRLK